MSTNHVRKGANRAGAMDKASRASQRSRMLPPRSEEAQELRRRAIAEAREQLAAAKESAQEKAGEERSDPIYTGAIDFWEAANAAGWHASFTTGWMDDGSSRTATVMATRGEERLVLTWLEGEPYRFPLFTDELGRNSRLASVADARGLL